MMLTEQSETIRWVIGQSFFHSEWKINIIKLCSYYKITKTVTYYMNSDCLKNLWAVVKPGD